MGDRSRDPGIVKLVTITKLHDRWALPFLTVILLTLLAFWFPATAIAAKSDLIQKSNEPEKKKGPAIPFPSLHRPAKGSPVNVEAEHLTYDPATEIAVATGQVRIIWGPYVLDATKVTYNRRTDQFNAEGQVRIIDPGGTVLEADVAQIEDQFRNGFARHLRMLLTNDATLMADYVVRRDGNLAVFEHVIYTRCKYCVLPNGVPFWQLKSATVEHDEALKRMYHHNVTLELAGIPVFWLPYLSHPDPSAKRASGFLTPTFFHSTDYGFGVETPYFFNLAPNYDLTVRPRFMTTDGVLAQATWRHRLDDGVYTVDAGGIYQTDTDLPPPGDRHFRGFVRTQGDFRINQKWTWGWDITGTTDDTFMRRYDIDERTELDNVVYLTGINDRNYFSARAYQFQGLLKDDNAAQFPIVAPYVRHDYTVDRPIFGGILGFDTNIYGVFRQDPLMPYPTVEQGTQQLRGIVQMNWHREVTTGDGVQITPFGRLRGDVYANNNLPDDNGSLPNDNDPSKLQGEQATSRLLPTGGIDLRWPFVRGDALGQQIVTPVVQVIAASDELDRDRIGNEDAITLDFSATSLFLQDRFTGLDRFEGGTRVNAGMLYTLLFPQGGFVRASVGESYHFAGANSFQDDSGLEDTASDIVSAVALQPFENFRFTAEARFDDQTFDVHAMEAGMNFDINRLNAAVNYVNLEQEPIYGRDDARQQIWATADYALYGGWSVFGGFRFDIESDSMIRNVVGIGYDCDCADVRLSYQEEYQKDRDIEPNRSIQLSVQLKTLGGGSIGAGL
jgi:LPS-assembly protein